MAELHKGYVNYLRDKARQGNNDRSLSCPLCSADIKPDINAFKAHVQADGDKHSALAGEADIEEAFRKMTIHSPQKKKTSPRSGPPRPAGRAQRKRPVPKEDSEDPPNDGDEADAEKSSSRVNKKMRSPTSSLAIQGPSSPPTTPSRSQRRSATVSDFDRGESAKTSTGRQLWDPSDESKQRSARPKTPTHKRGGSGRQRQERHQSPAPSPIDDSGSQPLFRQLETNPISQERLINEVKGIYAGLVMVENKCIEVDTSPSSTAAAEPDLKLEQWQKLISLHRSLLHEHHDFFLASQHPAANSGLRRLATKYQMPARLWRHGIHSFLEFLRHRLPASLEHMLTFIQLSYSLMTLLYETVPAFIETWIECLGDLSRYRMAIEDVDMRDRETWTGVSRYWYTKASDLLPETGRLYHHLAILARPHALQQLYFYCKSLCVPSPFMSAKDSIMTLFDPILDANPPHLDPVETAFVRVHGIIFSKKLREQLQRSMDMFLTHLNGSIKHYGKRWLESGYFIAIILSCSMLGYGSGANPLKSALKDSPDENQKMEEAEAADTESAQETFEEALSFAAQTYEIILRCEGSTETLPCIHATLVFLFYLSKHGTAMSLVDGKYPWKLTANMLNAVLDSLKSEPRMDRQSFPRPPQNEPLRPLPEDYALKGLRYSKNYFPGDWFSNERLEDDEKMFELPSMADERRQRILWLGRKIAASGKWLVWDEQTKEFSVNQQYEIDLDTAAS